MALVDPYTLQIGQHVSFNCSHPTDITTYDGTIVAISNYSMVSLIESDLIPYQQEVLKIKPEIQPLEKLKFITIEYFQNDISHKVSRALDWINVSTLKVHETENQFYICIYDRPDSEASTIIDLLESKGYICNFIKNVVAAD